MNFNGLLKKCVFEAILKRQNQVVERILYVHVIGKQTQHNTVQFCKLYDHRKKKKKKWYNSVSSYTAAGWQEFIIISIFFFEKFVHVQIF